MLGSETRVKSLAFILCPCKQPRTEAASGRVFLARQGERELVVPDFLPRLLLLSLSLFTTVCSLEADGLPSLTMPPALWTS